MRKATLHNEAQMQKVVGGGGGGGVRVVVERAGDVIPKIVGVVGGGGGGGEIVFPKVCPSCGGETIKEEGMIVVYFVLMYFFLYLHCIYIII